MNHLSRIEISKENLLSNIEQIKKFISSDVVNSESAPPKIAAVVKANAYGHGVREVVSVINDEVDYFQVDDLLELTEIRQYTDKPVLVFGFVSQNQLEDFVQLDGILGAYDIDTILSLNDIAKKIGKTAKIHLKIDSFLGRQGVLIEEAEEVLGKIKSLGNIDLQAVYSHFSNIEDTDDLSHAQKQFTGLMKVKELARKCGFENIEHHVSATSGILTSPGNDWGSDTVGSIVRFGVGLYGMWPSEGLRKKYEDKIKLNPVMKWTTKVAQVKTLPADYPIGYGCTYVTSAPMKIAVIPQGYSDGYVRHLSNNSEVLIRGRRCPVLGRVAMNMFVVDVSDLDDVVVEDEVVLLGKQSCKEGDDEYADEITAEELANRTDTINYEVTTRVWPKLERIIV